MYEPSLKKLMKNEELRALRALSDWNPVSEAERKSVEADEMLKDEIDIKTSFRFTEKMFNPEK